MRKLHFSMIVFLSFFMFGVKNGYCNERIYPLPSHIENIEDLMLIEQINKVLERIQYKIDDLEGHLEEIEDKVDDLEYNLILENDIGIYKSQIPNKVNSQPITKNNLKPATDEKIVSGLKSQTKGFVPSGEKPLIQPPQGYVVDEKPIEKPLPKPENIKIIKQPVVKPPEGFVVDEKPIDKSDIFDALQDDEYNKIRQPYFYHGKFKYRPRRVILEDK